MTRIQIVADHGTSHSAWTKAPADVAKIADRLGFVRVSAGRFRLGNFSFIRRALRKLRLEHGFERLCWKLELWALRRRFGKDGGELLLQHPLPGSWSFDLKNLCDLSQLKDSGVKFIVIVHDIGALRGSSKEVGGGGGHSFERQIFKLADKLIVHNDCMGSYIHGLGVGGVVVPLQVFDYLVNSATGFYRADLDLKRNGVLLVGGFGAGKARFSWDLKAIQKIDWVLYGHHYDPKIMDAPNIHYCGKFNADCPPISCGCRFGLVWDGDTIETCSGSTGEYLRTNNPHKFSLYLAMGMPVIVWKQSAIAPFVMRYRIGLLVDSLVHLAVVLEQVSDVEYFEMTRNANLLAKKLRSGEFTRMALLK